MIYIIKMANLDSDVMLKVVCLLSLVFLNAGLASNYWTVNFKTSNASNNSSARFGLWELCSSDNKEHKNCVKLNKENSFPLNKEWDVLQVCRVFSVLCVLLVFVVVLMMFLSPNNNMCKWLLLSVVLLSFIVVVMWVAKLVKVQTQVTFKGEVGASLYFFVVGGLLALSAGVMCWKN